jgi:hypothetical protein
MINNGAMSLEHTLTAILPCNDLDASEAFYALLGFSKRGDYGDYRILRDDGGASLHLNKAPEGWLIPGRNPCGLYLYTESVAELVETLVRVGRPSLHPASS